MATATSESLLPPLVLRFGSASKHLTDAEFYEFCQSNRNWRIERPQTINAPATLSGEPELAGFTLDLAPIWS